MSLNNPTNIREKLLYSAYEICTKEFEILERTPDFTWKWGMKPIANFDPGLEIEVAFMPTREINSAWPELGRISLAIVTSINADGDPQSITVSTKTDPEYYEDSHAEGFLDDLDGYDSHPHIICEGLKVPKPVPQELFSGYDQRLNEISMIHPQPW